MPLPAAISSALGLTRRLAVNTPDGPSASTRTPGRSLASCAVWSPTRFTVSRSHSSLGAADSENGCDCHQHPSVRNRQRKNCPACTGRSRRRRPERYSDTMSALSGITAMTRNR